MNTDALRLAQDALWLVLILSAPIVVTAALVGLVVSFIQAVTQIQEQTLAFAIKFFVIALVLFLMASTLGGAIYTYTDRIFVGLPNLVRR
jgi:type III secretion protein S